jgi:uncharacterized protein YqfA (UPF0365 family)
VSIAVVIVVLAAAMVLAIGFAFLPMRLLLSHMAANIHQFILRRQERRVAVRPTPERRKEGEKP